MTLNELIAYVDETRPNQYSNAHKTRWVSEVEHKAINEVFNRIDSPDFVIYEPYEYEKDKDTELLIPDQFDDVYITYVYGKIDFTNSEIERYNNDATAFSSAWDEFAAWIRREFKPLPHNFSLPIPPEASISMRDVRSLLDLLTDISKRIDEFGEAVLSSIGEVKSLPEWVKQPEKPKYTAEEVGAVTEEQLKVASQNAEDNAVKRANAATDEAIAGLELITAADVDNIVSGKGYQTANDVEQAISDKGYQTAEDVSKIISDEQLQSKSDVETAIANKGYQTADDVESAIAGKGYATASDVNKALSDIQTDFSQQIAAEAKTRSDADAEIVKKLEDKTNVLDVLFRLPRTGKVYTVKIPKFASNPTTVCKKLDDNAGLVCEPSTDTVEGQDDYENIPLFKWYNCNYVRDDNGHAYPTAIEGIDSDYKTSGDIDVGVIQMAPYVKWDESADDYIILSITDSPKEGYTLWSTARYDDTEYPYVIHSKYFSGLVNGLLRSQPNLKPERLQSYSNIISNYLKKGKGYHGAEDERNSWQIIFTLIKYATKSSQTVFAGCTNYSFQYAASIQRETKETYFPVTKAQAANIVVGGYVSVGYQEVSGSALSTDRGYANIHKYADDVKVLKVEPIDDNNSAVYLGIETGFDTKPVAVTDTLTSQIYISSMHWYSGSTDSVKGKRDGSFVSNTNSKYPYRVQGIEYAIGGYFIASDVAIQNQLNIDKKVFAANKKARSSSESVIVNTYKDVGTIPGNNGNDYWIGDISFDAETCVFYASAIGSGDKAGVGDRLYVGGAAASGLREYLIGGSLGNGSYAGSSFSVLWSWLGEAVWGFLSAD